jgi:hypothetical protein
MLACFVIFRSVKGLQAASSGETYDPACSFGWCMVFVLRGKYCWLVASGWFVLREKYFSLAADKPCEQGSACN